MTKKSRLKTRPKTAGDYLNDYYRLLVACNIPPNEIFKHLDGFRKNMHGMPNEVSSSLRRVSEVSGLGHSLSIRARR